MKRMKVERLWWEVTCNHRDGFNRIQVEALTSRSAIALAKKEWSTYPQAYDPTLRPGASFSAVVM